MMWNMEWLGENESIPLEGIVYFLDERTRAREDENEMLIARHLPGCVRIWFQYQRCVGDAPFSSLMRHF